MFRTIRPDSPADIYPHIKEQRDLFLCPTGYYIEPRNPWQDPNRLPFRIIRRFIGSSLTVSARTMGYSERLSRLNVQGVPVSDDDKRRYTQVHLIVPKVMEGLALSYEGEFFAHLERRRVDFLTITGPNEWEEAGGNDLKHLTSLAIFGYINGELANARSTSELLLPSASRAT